MILACIVLTQYNSVTDGRMDRRTDERLNNGYDALNTICSRGWKSKAV